MKTTNYEISKQLAEAGFKAKSIFGWHVDGKECAPSYPLSPTATGYFWSYDLETILQALPESVKFDNKWAWFEMDKNFIIYEFTDEDNTCLFDFHKQENESLADTAARLWLKLKERGLV